MSEWIPVEERLPDNVCDQFVTFNDGQIGVAYYGTSTLQWHGMHNNVLFGVIAWQPISMPAPYVKPGRFVVGEETGRFPGLKVMDTKNRAPCAVMIPTREAAEQIAEIYERAYAGGE